MLRQARQATDRPDDALPAPSRCSRPAIARAPRRPTASSSRRSRRTSRRARTSASCWRSSGASRRPSRRTAPPLQIDPRTAEDPPQPRHRALQGRELRRRRHRAGGGPRRAARQPAGALPRSRLPSADGRAKAGDCAPRAESSRSTRTTSRSPTCSAWPTCRRRTSRRAGLLVDRILKRGESAEAHLMMGMAKRAAQDLAGGLEELGKAVGTRTPSCQAVHSLYGRALLETGNRDRAQAEFESRADARPARLRCAPVPRRPAEGGREVRRGDGPLRARPRRPAWRSRRALPDRDDPVLARRDRQARCRSSSRSSRKRRRSSRRTSRWRRSTTG